MTNVFAGSRAKLIYLSIVIGVGLGVLIDALRTLWAQPPGATWVLLSALTLLTGSFTVKLPSLSAKISVSETFVFASALLFGPAAGTITVALDSIVISLWMKRQKRTLTRFLFNCTAPAIALRISSEAYFWLSATVPGHVDLEHNYVILPSLIFALLYFLINTALVTGVLSLERREPPLRLWWTHFPPVSITYFVGSSTALLIAAFTTIWLTIIAIIVPLIFISYFTFRTSMGRLEDANRHVAQLNELYLSTIETLAMAVDAKDQVTHGHIRRVQVYAVELAKRLGIGQKEHLQAIEAAALLHDMGKLAIPEHILNKPGALTAAEFAKMKRHADIGADLLSSITFPYPVVPIVRHHHENWDGTGYPAGLTGADIPLGARVLSVVDCFDALTSDRPYRPRLSADDAFEILRQRSGSMYDPLVVATFITAYHEIAPAAKTAGEQAHSLTTVLASAEVPSAPLRDISANAAQTACLAEFASVLERTSGLHDLTAVTFQYARRLMPATAIAVYRFASDLDTLSCVCAGGDPERLLEGIEIKNGERISGWVAANEKTIANSQAALDLGVIAETFVPPLRSSLATPLRSNGRTIGTLTVYSSREQPFSDDHRYAFERLTDTFVAYMDSATPGKSTAVLKFVPPERSSSMFGSSH